MSRPTVMFEDGQYNGPTLREWLPEVIDCTVAEFDPVKVILFGSLARGEEDGDVDLLVVLLRVEGKLEAMTALRRAMNGIPVPKDLIVSDPEELEQLSDVVGYIFRPALREGRWSMSERAEAVRGATQPSRCAPTTT